MSVAPSAIILCADDFGLGEGACRGILRLAEGRRISATSVMTNGTAWRRYAPALAQHRSAIAVGLHVVLTWGRPLGPMPHLAPSGSLPRLRELLTRALTHRLDTPEIEGEIARQLDAFTNATGAPPDFVDGHQHVHAFPGIREALIRALDRRGLVAKPWLRNPADQPAAIVRRRLSAGKALFVAATASGFASAVRRSGYATNAGFSGFSTFDPSRDVGADFPRYLEALGPSHLVMCHPGEDRGEPLGDDIAASRPRELAYLESAAFAGLLADRGIVLVPRPS